MQRTFEKMHQDRLEAKDVQLQQKEHEIQQKDKVIHQKNQEASKNFQLLIERDQVIKRLSQELSQKNKEIQCKIKESQQKNTEIQLQYQQMHSLKEENESLQEQVDDLKTPTWVIKRGELKIFDKKLGTGGWGSVREAIFRGCKVAVKSLDSKIISPYYLELFSREMSMAARCRHPNLMQFIGATNEGIPLIVTELMHSSLREILEQGQLLSNQIISISQGVAYGLNYLHKNSPTILHRDVSSANVLLNPLPNNKWHPKLSDFGSTNFMRVSKTVAAGNPIYAAPEALTPQEHSPAMDVFSFGVLMYEMCSRKFPVEQPKPSSLYRVKWAATETTLVGLIQRCLSEEIKRRPTMEVVIHNL